MVLPSAKMKFFISCLVHVNVVSILLLLRLCQMIFQFYSVYFQYEFNQMDIYVCTVYALWYYSSLSALSAAGKIGSMSSYMFGLLIPIVI